MEEKIKYKKCPHCDLNYIPTNAICCTICSQNPVIIKKIQNSLLQRNEKQIEEFDDELDKLLDELLDENFDKDLELNNRKTLLKLLEKYGFFGFLHTTNFDNFINIYKSGFLKSRKQLINEGILFEDNAESSVLEHTSEIIKSKTRFYYRAKTPTNYSAYTNHNQQNPVIIVFDKNLIFNDEALFCDGGAGTGTTNKTPLASTALDFDWNAIFSDSSIYSSNSVLKNYRNAEFLLPSPISMKNATKIYFRNQKDYLKACTLFGKDVRFELKPNLFY